MLSPTDKSSLFRERSQVKVAYIVAANGHSVGDEVFVTSSVATGLCEDGKAKLAKSGKGKKRGYITK